MWESALLRETLALGDLLLTLAELLLDPALLGVLLWWDLLASLGVGLHLIGDSLPPSNEGLLLSDTWSGDGVLGPGVAEAAGGVGLLGGVAGGSDLTLLSLLPRTVKGRSSSSSGSGSCLGLDLGLFF